MFSDLDSVEKHKEVLTFACGLSDQVAQVVCEYLSIVCKLSPGNTKVGFEILAEKDKFSKTFHRALCTDLQQNPQSAQRVPEELVMRTELHFENENLRGLLKFLTEQSHPGFPSLEKLYLWATHLNGEDVESLSEAVRAGKLPRLNWLSLSHNDLRHMEREVEALIAACDAHCQKRVMFWLWGTGLSAEFIQRCKVKYRNVEIDWRL